MVMSGSGGTLKLDNTLTLSGTFADGRTEQAGKRDSFLLTMEFFQLTRTDHFLSTCSCGFFHNQNFFRKTTEAGK